MQKCIIRTFTKRLLNWYASHGRMFPWREPSRSNYEKVIAELLLQRTCARTVAHFYLAFLNQFNDWPVIATSNEEYIGQCLRPLGLWKRRAVSLKCLAIEMTVRNGVFPSTREEVEKLPGVGQYIASAILLLCHGKPNPLLDGNMARVLERFFGPRKFADIRYDPSLQSLARVVTKHKRSLEINWAILDLASLVCKKRTPTCRVCPMSDMCRYFLSLPAE